MSSTVTAVVVAAAHSPHARLKPVPVSSVALGEGFWTRWQRLNREIMLPAQYRLCESTGRIENLRRASGKAGGEFQGWFFNDSDVYKWVEAAAWSLAGTDDADLSGLIDAVIAQIAAAQEPDGYLNSYFSGPRVGERWTNPDLHEMYCAGHLLQAAVAHHRVTGKTSLLDVATRFADYLCERFGPEAEGKQFWLDGHPEIEMALVELFRETGGERYLRLAEWLLNERGHNWISGHPRIRRGGDYYQDDTPLAEMSRLEGHAVRAMYLNCGAADLVAETGDPALRGGLERMWQNMTERQMYVSGGLGSRYETEGFGPDYELPNGRAHTETCAGVGNFLWNYRMLMLAPDAKYADLMELALYNAVLPGVSLDGQAYFYENPLSDDGGHRREQWFTVACCPSNLSRLIAALPGYMYGTTAEGVWVHLYAASRAEAVLPSGRAIVLEQRGNYPWSGEIEIEVGTEGKYALFLRLPGWGRGQGEPWSLRVNGQQAPAPGTPGGYLRLSREWRAGDVVQLNLPMPVRRVACNPLVVDNQDRVALMRGPLLYCVEGADHPGVDVRLLQLPATLKAGATFRPDLLGGVVVIEGAAYAAVDELSWGSSLYTAYHAGIDKAMTVPFTAIPYYAWANRAAGPMQVWLRQR